MEKNGSIPERELSLRVGPEREALTRACCEKLGYRMAELRREEHSDTELRFVLERPESYDSGKMERCRGILGKLGEIDKKVTRYFLKLDCLIGLMGAICIGLSFAALRAGVQWLFTVLLALGIFGCTITLYLRPVFTRMGREKYAGEEPALLAELEAILDSHGEGESE